MLNAVLGFLERPLGLDTSWRAGSVGDDRLGDAGDLELLMSSWALCVEFVHDLTRCPKDTFLQPLQTLPRNVVESSRALALAETDREAFPHGGGLPPESRGEPGIGAREKDATEHVTGDDREIGAEPTVPENPVPQASAPEEPCCARERRTRQSP